jgi:hypothetical protein
MFCYSISPKTCRIFFLEYFVAGKYFVRGFPNYHIDFPIIILVGHKIIYIGLDPVKRSSTEATNSINYFSCFGSKQILVEKDIDIY